MGGELDVLSLGEVSATSLGLNVKACKFMFLASSAMLAGSAVSFAGLVGFVGLIVPHVARMVAGTGSSRRLIVLSALIGGAFFEGCDIASRMLFSPYELPTGIVTAFLGAPFFLFLLIKRRRGYRY
jgi:iron complex transport system permease protein